MTISDMIAAIEARTDGSYKGTTNPTFTSAAIGAETVANNGIYKVADGMYDGNSYYWRGAATTNHVIFDSKCWRIVRINGDKSIRLIYNGTPSGTTSRIKTELESWYGSSISGSAKSKVEKGNFCNDRNTQNNETWRATGNIQYYAVYQRLSSGTKMPTLSCPNGDVYSLDVGMITADEVQYAGASYTTTNTSYFLYNGQDYWTMSPRNWDGAYAYVFHVDSNGRLGYQGFGNVNNSNNGVRPVINLRSDVTFNAGSDGTSSNPYIVQ